MKKFQKVFVAGTFDFLHVGHQYLLWTAVNSANSLVVIVARDENVCKIKGKLPHFNEQERVERILREFLPKTEVKLGGDNLDDFFQTLKNEQPGAIFLGYDQKLQFPAKKVEKLGIKIIRINSFYPKFFKSSYFKK